MNTRHDGPFDASHVSNRKTVKEEAAPTARRPVGPVAVDIGVEKAELPEQGALGLGLVEDAALDGFVFAWPRR